MTEDNPRSCSTCAKRNICALRAQLFDSTQVKITPAAWPRNAHMSSAMARAGMIELARTCGHYDLDTVNPPLMKVPTGTEVAESGRKVLESLM